MSASEPPELDLGTVRLRWLNGGAFRLDGAAVFGQVPRPVWSTLLPPDADNRVGLAAHVLLVELGDEVGVIEAGIPHTLNPRQRAFMVVERPGSIDADLAAIGISRQDIRWVILTHLHPDHAGGLLVHVGQAPAPLFPNARHVVQRRELETLSNPDYPWRHTFDADGFEILRAGGLVDQVDGEATVAPAVRVVRTGGHTAGHQAVVLEGSTASAICMGDLLPTRHHVDPVRVPAVDDFPLESIKVKRAELARAHEHGAWLIFGHDRDLLALRYTPEGAAAEELWVSAG